MLLPLITHAFSIDKAFTSDHAVMTFVTKKVVAKTQGCCFLSRDHGALFSAQHEDVGRNLNSNQQYQLGHYSSKKPVIRNKPFSRDGKFCFKFRKPPFCMQTASACGFQILFIFKMSWKVFLVDHPKIAFLDETDCTAWQVLEVCCNFLLCLHVIEDYFVFQKLPST